MRKSGQIVAEYARMWPRDILYLGKKELGDIGDRLKGEGVYILYRDERPYYIGRTDNLFKRLCEHANNPSSVHFSFWNSFSAYKVSKDFKSYIPEIEGILITSMVLVTANRQKPKIKKISLSKKLWKRAWKIGGGSHAEE